MRSDLLTAALERVAPLARSGDRAFVGIAGPPGAGKSTLAEALADALVARFGQQAAVAVPMDGFHLSNVELGRLGLANRKGALETFDAHGFVHLLQRIKQRVELVYAPAYSRVVHESVGGVIPVDPATRVIIVEGNYLLVPDDPWARARALFDLAFYVDLPDEARVAGLLRRQREFGLDEAAAAEWVERNDEVNARLVATTRPHADVVLHRGEG